MLNTFLLIDLVQKYPALYDPLHEDYENKIKKVLYWKKISTFLECEDNVAIAAWDSIKNSYMVNILSEVKKTNLKDSSKYDERLSFLFPVVVNLIKQRYQDYKLEELYNSDDQNDENTVSTKNYNDKIELARGLSKMALIDLVKQIPPLYEINCEDTYSIDPCWEYISMKMGASVEQCKEAWNTLKRIYHKIITQEENIPSKRLKWTYEQNMEFAREFVEHEVKTNPELYEVSRNDRSLSEMLSSIPSSIEYFAKVQDIIETLPKAKTENIEKKIDTIIKKVQSEYRIKEKNLNSKTIENCSTDVDEDEDVIIIENQPEVIEIDSDDNNDDGGGMIYSHYEPDSNDDQEIIGM